MNFFKRKTNYVASLDLITENTPVDDIVIATAMAMQASQEKPKKETEEQIQLRLIMEVHSLIDSSSSDWMKENFPKIKEFVNQEDLQKLEELGFVNTPMVEEYRRSLALQNRRIAISDFIAYYQHHYPQYKFILADDIISIGKKYGLVCGNVKLYKGEIPTKNVKEILAFKIREEDEAWLETRRGTDYEYADYVPLANRKSYLITGRVIKSAPFEILAPASMMEMERRGYRTELKDGVNITFIKDDPAVLKPVYWETEESRTLKGYLVASKWGMEAEITDLQNQKDN